MLPFRPNEPAYAGVGITFCRTPLVLDPAGLSGVDVAVLGAPFDEGVTYRPGTRFGPRAIRQAEDAGHNARPSIEVGLNPFEAIRVVDYGDIEAVPAGLERSLALLREHVGHILSAGAVAVVLGGDHSLSLPMLQACSDRFGPDGYAVIHFDTHADTGLGDEYYNHGAPFSRAVEEGALRGDRIFQIGLRGSWPYPHEWDRMREQGFRWRTMDEVTERGLPAVVAEAIAWSTERAPRVYLTVDIDVLDPAFAPGTGTPEPGGLMTRELLAAVRTISRAVDLCAMDLVEVSPPYDPAGVTALAGHRVVLETITGIAARKTGHVAAPQRWEQEGDRGR